MDFTDFCLVYIAGKLNLNVRVIIDRHFSIYRVQEKRKFKIILSLSNSRQ